LQTAAYAREKLQSVGRLPFHAPVFNEFVVESRHDAEWIRKKLEVKKIFAGIPLGRYYPELKNHLLICVTEMTRRDQIDQLTSELEALA
jgi:glycine dehydrogenase subunit 1